MRQLWKEPCTALPTWAAINTKLQKTFKQLHMFTEKLSQRLFHFKLSSNKRKTTKDLLLFSDKSIITDSLNTLAFKTKYNCI